MMRGRGGPARNPGQPREAPEEDDRPRRAVAGRPQSVAWDSYFKLDPLPETIVIEDDMGVREVQISPLDPRLGEKLPEQWGGLLASKQRDFQMWYLREHTQYAACPLEYDSEVRLSVVNEWFNSYKLQVPSHRKEEIETSTGMSTTGYLPSAAGNNEHAILAAYREAGTALAIKSALQALHDMGQPFELQFVYGNKRDARIMRSLNTYLFDCGCAPVDYLVTGRPYEAQDLLRRPGAADERDFGVPIFIDVYHDGARPFSHDSVCDRKPLLAFWLGHPFPGQLGVCDTAVWHREGEDIFWISDTRSPAYLKHPACDDMHCAEARDGYARAIRHTYSYRDQIVYNLVQFTPSDLSQPKGDNAVHRHGNSVPVSIPDYHAWSPQFLTRLAPRTIGWLGRILDTMSFSTAGRRTVHVHKQHLTALQDHMASRTYNTWTYRSLALSAQQILSDDPAMRVIRRAHPDWYVRYVTDLTVACFCYRAQERSFALDAVRWSYAQFFTDYNQSLNTIDTPEPRSRLPYVAAFALFLFLARNEI